MQVLEVLAGLIMAGLVLSGIVYLLRWWLTQRQLQKSSHTPRK